LPNRSVITDQSIGEIGKCITPRGHAIIPTDVLPECQNDSGLAAYISRLLAGHVACHFEENQSHKKLANTLAIPMQLFSPIAAWLGILDMCLFPMTYFQNRRAQRQESERDHIALIFVHRARYDTQEVIGLLTRMDKIGEKINAQIFEHANKIFHVLVELGYRIELKKPLQTIPSVRNRLGMHVI